MNFTEYIPWLISLGMLVVAVVTLSRNGRKDRRAEYIEESTKIQEIEQSLIKVDVKLDQLCVTTTETRTDIKTMNKGLQDIDKRVTKIESDMTTMWKRYDEMKTKMEHYHEGH